MNKLFEAVPVSEKPPTNRFWCIAIDDKGSLFEAMYHQDKWYQSWDDGKQDDITDITRFWLRPLPPPTKEAEQRTKELYPDRPDSLYADIAAKAQRAAYLKGHQEASTGQAGEVKLLRDALQQMIDLTTEVLVRAGYDFPTEEKHINLFNVGIGDKGKTYKRIVDTIDAAKQALSSTPSHTEEDDWVRVGWISTVTNEPPKKPGKNSYEHVPCLVLRKGVESILLWNCEHLCWDDEEGDDYECNYADVSHYIPLERIPRPGQSPTPTTDKQ